MVTDALIRPLDGMRRTLWRWTATTSLGRACIKDRSARHAALALGHMSVALTLTVLAPLWLLLLGPIVLGVPHLATDVRYLLVRPLFPLGRRGLVLVLGPLAAMTLLRVLPIFGVPSLPYQSAVETGLGMAAIIGGVSLARTGPRTRLAFIALALALGVVGAMSGRTASLIVAHLHNFVAFGFWLWLYRSEAPARRTLLVTGAYLGACALILGGAFDGVLMAQASGHAGRLDLDYMVQSVATDIEPVLAMRLVALYAFCQSIHYAIWIRLVPQRMDPRPAPPTFARTVGRLREDFGRKGFAAIVLFTLAVPIAAVFMDAVDVRLAYLVVIVGHGWLELAVFAALGVQALGVGAASVDRAAAAREASA
ncbi:MAG: hypothetical protein U1F43_39190 [Myxococcota bacterium]